MASEEVSKLNSYGVLDNKSLWTTKFNAYAVLGPVVPIDLAGNLGGASSYGRFHYGLAKYSRVNAFAPGFGADLTITPPTAIEISGAMGPQITFAGTLGFDVSLTALDGSFGFTIVYGAAEMISGPLWANSEPCPSAPWGPSEPCPVPPWMAAAACAPVVWNKSRLCNG